MYIVCQINRACSSEIVSLRPVNTHKPMTKISSGNFPIKNRRKYISIESEVLIQRRKLIEDVAIEVAIKVVHRAMNTANIEALRGYRVSTRKG